MFWKKKQGINNPPLLSKPWTKIVYFIRVTHNLINDITFNRHHNLLPESFPETGFEFHSSLFLVLPKPQSTESTGEVTKTIVSSEIVHGCAVLYHRPNTYRLKVGNGIKVQWNVESHLRLQTSSASAVYLFSALIGPWVFLYLCLVRLGFREFHTHTHHLTLQIFINSFGEGAKHTQPQQKDIKPKCNYTETWISRDGFGSFTGVIAVGIYEIYVFLVLN